MFSHRCAFCGNQTHFTARHGRVYDTRLVVRDGYSVQLGKISVAATCDACSKYNIATGDLAGVRRSNALSQYIAGETVIREAARMENETWSPPAMIQADTAHIPAEVAGFYQEAHDAFSIGAYRAVLLLSRSVIEATAKLKEVSGANLVKKIDNLHEEGHIRRGVKQVAHALRHVGNDIAHGDLTDPPTAEDADDVLKLVRLILDDVYVTDAVRVDILTRRGKPVD